MDRKYNLKLDLQFRCNNSKMIFDEFDENTSDFFMQITRQGKRIDISNAIPTLLVLKPSGVAQAQILEVKDNCIYGNLKMSLKDEVGTYIAKLMLVEGDKKTFISNISYEVTENALLGKIDNDIVEDERYSVLIQLLERLSNIELQEQTRVDNENYRIEAENLRQEAIEKVKNDINILISETNKKVNDNLNSNTSKIDNLVIETKEELNEYKSNKDISIDEDLREFKENTNKSIQDYKTSKDIEINNILSEYKNNTTNDINDFKDVINSKIDKYKNDKDKAINEYIEAKSLELDNYVEAKNKEIDEYKTSKNNELDLYISEKNTLIDSKISEVDTVKKQLQNSVNSKLIEVDNAENQRQQEHESRQQFLDGFEGKLNTVVDDVAGIKDDVVSVREANKRQDIFLQGLYNENLDGRVTVKEEGSVISLTNSDDGLVDIIGLEGNTLVNYVQDGAKELTLNGDIDVEGTNITLTECVDDGLVDVVCEGNTLVNLIVDENILLGGFAGELGDTIRSGSNKARCRVKVENIKPNTSYTIIPTSEKQDHGLFIIDSNNTIMNTPVWNAGKFNFETTNDASYIGINFKIDNETIITDVSQFKKSFILLEGDWVNRELPSHFEGMKSVGECEDNKIEILSRNGNKNTYDNTKYINPNGATLTRTDTGFVLESAIRNGVRITKVIDSDGYWSFSCYAKASVNTQVAIDINDKDGQIYNVGTEWTRIEHTSNTQTMHSYNSGIYTFIDIAFADLIGNDATSILDRVEFKDVKIEKGKNITPYEYREDKKEISLSEPLRALPNGVKDKIVEIGGKWYVERNCEIDNVDNNKKWNLSGQNNSDYCVAFAVGLNAINLATSNIISDTLPTLNSFDDAGKRKGIYLNANSSNPNGNFVISVPSSECNSLSGVEGVKYWLQNNPTTVVYQLATPIYEELPIDPTLLTYLDTTHISNNSTIPCNMTIKNTGYNAIIKPSTQYTVAFDTDKTGEVGINLGGSKVTTTNNVVTVTTPSTLTDDSLRLYGKGIKASRVRLLEGDKTNWVPSHFEGMKSSFEDKVQDDGIYKMEILSNNKNLCTVNNYNLNCGVGCSTNSFKGTVIDKNIKVKPNTKYYVIFDYIKGKNTHHNIKVMTFTDKIKDSEDIHANCYTHKNRITENTVYKHSYFITEPNCHYITLTVGSFLTDGDLEINNISISEINHDKYTPQKSNKIQFSSMEPLRELDRFVFKDNQLMIERNSQKLILNGQGYNDDFFVNYHSKEGKYIRFIFDNKNLKAFDTTIKCSKLPTLSDGNFTQENIQPREALDRSAFYLVLNNSKVTNTADLNKFLSNNPLEILSKKAEPTYEEVPFELQKIILEGYENGTLFFDTNIPPTVEASYTANIPVVSKLNKVNETTETNTEDIAITQMAVDFLLMSTLGEEMLNFKVRSGYNMASYFASRIIKGALKYEDVIKKYPQYKEDINSILISEGHSDLIVEL